MDFPILTEFRFGFHWFVFALASQNEPFLRTKYEVSANQIRSKLERISKDVRINEGIYYWLK